MTDNQIIHINKAYKFLKDCESRYVHCYGGAGSGKSYAIAQTLNLMLGTKRNERWMLVRKFYKHIRNSQFKLLTDIIAQHNLPYVCNVSTMSIHNPATNSELIAVGIDDPEKIKSFADPTGAWIEEMTELNEEDFDQIDLRIRKPNHKLQIIGSYNPINKQHWIYERFHKNQDVNMGIPYTYSLTSRVKVNNEIRVITNDVTILRTNYEHNRFLPDQYLAELKHLELVSPNRYKIYALGEWGLAEDGFLFSRDFYHEYDFIPDDAKGVIYCDPNLSKKGKGDTSCLIKMLFSPSTQKYYVADAIVKSFSNSNEWLDALLRLRGNDERIRAIGFDGSVSQESHWTQHVTNYSRQHGIPFPVIEYKRYKVDELSKNAQWIWAAGDLLFPKNFGETEDGERFLVQLFSFAGKKFSKAQDDAPDAMICAVEFLFERGYRQRKHAGLPEHLKHAFI